MLRHKKVHKGYVVYDDNKGKEHTHIRTEKTCLHLIWCIENNIIPESLYLRESVRRLLPPKEYEKLREKRRKDYYVNVNGKRGIK